MSADNDAEKTEEPTGKKLNKQRDEGNVAVSTEVKNWFGILSFFIFVAFLLPVISRELLQAFEVYLDEAGTLPTDTAALYQKLQRMVIGLAFLLAVPFAIFIGLAIFANVYQNGLMWVPSKLKFDIAKLNPISGFKRMFSLNQFVELPKGIAKIVIIGVGAYLVVRPELSRLNLLIDAPLSSLLWQMWIVAVKLILVVLIVFLLVAILDLVYQRWSYTQKNKMTKQEVKDEHKQSEGDPQVKARIRKVRFERYRERMMANVPNADVVVTNPTHFAVALKYDPETMGAPRVTAKGADLIAATIRRIAEEHGIPIMQNPPLARALYDTTEVDQEIPTEHYKAVAEVISFVFRQQRRKVPA